MFRSVISVLVGLVVMTAVAFAIEFAVDAFLLHSYPVNFPSEAAFARNNGVMLLTLAYSLVCMILGGYITARLAPRSPVAHAMVLAGLQEVLTIIAIVEKVAPSPRWAWIANLLLVPIAIILGGYWRARR